MIYATFTHMSWNRANHMAAHNFKGGKEVASCHGTAILPLSQLCDFGTSVMLS